VGKKGKDSEYTRSTARERERARVKRENETEGEKERQCALKPQRAAGTSRTSMGTRTHLGRGCGRFVYCLAVYGVRDSEAAPAGLGQHARRRPISRMGAGERTPIQAGEGALTVHVILVPRTLVADPASPGERAVPMLLVVVIRASCCRNTRPCSCARLPLDISSSLENSFFSMNTQLQFHRAI